jgi:hypothetical protein
MPKIPKEKKQVKKVVNASHACYVLITCSEPNADGKMEVEMKYDGDETLAAFLIENAAQVFDNRFQCRESK